MDNCRNLYFPDNHIIVLFALIIVYISVAIGHIIAIFALVTVHISVWILCHFRCGSRFYLSMLSDLRLSISISIHITCLPLCMYVCVGIFVCFFSITICICLNLCIYLFEFLFVFVGCCGCDSSLEGGKPRQLQSRQLASCQPRATTFTFQVFLFFF